MTARRKLLITAGIAIATVMTWAAWLGWDTERDLDPVTLRYSGPYQAWQVAGCVLCLAAIAAAGGWLAGPLLTTPAMALSFTAAWTAGAARTATDGLFVIGAVLVLIGTAVGALLVSAAAARLRSVTAGRRPAPPANAAGR